MSFVRPGESGHVVKSIRDPGPPTLREIIDGLRANIQEAARREQRALADYQALPPGDRREVALKGWEAQAKTEQAHWREYLAVYRRWLDLHPELADRPLRTACAHGPTCSLDRPKVREIGADDDEPSAQHWSDDAA